MQGVILIVYNDAAVEVEFVKEDRTNYEYNCVYTFTLNADDFKLVSTHP